MSNLYSTIFEDIENKILETKVLSEEEGGVTKSLVTGILDGDVSIPELWEIVEGEVDNL